MPALEYDTEYDFEVGTGLTDAAGNPLTTLYSGSFLTMEEAITPVTPPTNGTDDGNQTDEAETSFLADYWWIFIVLALVIIIVIQAMGGKKEEDEEEPVEETIEDEPPAPPMQQEPVVEEPPMEDAPAEPDIEPEAPVEEIE